MCLGPRLQPARRPAQRHPAVCPVSRLQPERHPVVYPGPRLQPARRPARPRPAGGFPLPRLPRGDLWGGGLRVWYPQAGCLPAAGSRAGGPGPPAGSRGSCAGAVGPHRAPVAPGRGTGRLAVPVGRGFRACPAPARGRAARDRVPGAPRHRDGHPAPARLRPPVSTRPPRACPRGQAGAEARTACLELNIDLIR